MFLLYVLDPTTGGGPPVTGSVVWAEAAQMLSAISGGSPVLSGQSVARWLADDSVNALDQVGASSLRPLADIDSTFPGRSALTFQNDRHLTRTLAAAPDTFLLIVGPQGSTARTLLTRDTSQTTTAPAFSIAVEEYFV